MILAAILIPLDASLEEVQKRDRWHGKVMCYVRKLSSRGMVPIFVWPGMPMQQYMRAYGETDGVLLVGGDDIDASLWGEENHPCVKLDASGRDGFEMSIISQVMRYKKPVLGICRGMQALVVANGGSLIQHLPDVTDELHGSGNHRQPVQADVYHEIIINPDTRSRSIIGKDRIVSSSYHHQAANKVPGNLIVSAQSPNGIIEMVESADEKHFCFGIQGHPERMEKSDLDVFFREFANATSR